MTHLRKMALEERHARGLTEDLGCFSGRLLVGRRGLAYPQVLVVGGHDVVGAVLAPRQEARFALRLDLQTRVLIVEVTVGDITIAIELPVAALLNRPLVVDAAPATTAELAAAAPLPAAIPASQIRRVISIDLFDDTTGEKVTRLEQPLTFSIEIQAEDLAAAGGNPNRLRVMRLDESGVFLILPGAYNAATGQLDTTTSRTSLFAVAVIPEDTPAIKDYDITNGHFFSQASGLSGQGGLGFSIVDKLSEPAYWTAFKEFGGFERLGYVATRPMVFAGREVQVTQKAILQWNPELGGFVLGNIMDDLHAIGLDNFLDRDHLVPPVRDLSPDAGLGWDAIAQRHLAFLDEDYEGMAAISELYHKRGLGFAVTHYGLPMGVKDYGAVVVLRAQRAVFHYWKTETPWSKKGEVVLANVGDIAKSLEVFDPDGVSLEFPPANTTS